MEKIINFEVVVNLKMYGVQTKLSQTNSITLNTSKSYIKDEYFVLEEKNILSFIDVSLNEYCEKNNISASNDIEIISYNAYSKEKDIEVFFDKTNFYVPILKCFIKKLKLSGKPKFTYTIDEYNNVTYTIEDDKCDHILLDENNNIIMIIDNDILTFNEKITKDVKRKMISMSNDYYSDESDIFEIHYISNNNVGEFNYNPKRSDSYDLEQDVSTPSKYFKSGIGYDDDCKLYKESNDVDMDVLCQYNFYGKEKIQHEYNNKITFDYRCKMNASYLKDSKNGNVKLYTKAYPILTCVCRLYKYAIAEMTVKYTISGEYNYLHKNNNYDYVLKTVPINLTFDYKLTKDNLSFTNTRYARTKSQKVKLGKLKDIIKNNITWTDEMENPPFGQGYFTNLKITDTYSKDTGDETIYSNDITGNNNAASEDGSFRISNLSCSTLSPDDDIYAIGRTDAQIYEACYIKECRFNMYDYPDGYLAFSKEECTERLHNLFNDKLMYNGSDVLRDVSMLYVEKPCFAFKEKNDNVYIKIIHYHETNTDNHIFDFPDYHEEDKLHSFKCSYTSPQGLGTRIFLYSMDVKTDNSSMYKLIQVNNSSEDVLSNYTTNSVYSYIATTQGNSTFKSYLSKDGITAIDNKIVKINILKGYTCRSEKIEYTKISSSTIKCNHEYIMPKGEYVVVGNDDLAEFELLIRKNSDGSTKSYKASEYQTITITVDEDSTCSLTIVGINGSSITEKNINMYIVNHDKQNVKHITEYGTSFAYDYDTLFNNKLLEGVQYKFVTTIQEVNGLIYYNGTRKLNTGDTIVSIGDRSLIASYESRTHRKEEIIEQYFPPIDQQPLHGVINGDINKIKLTNGKLDYNIRCYLFKLSSKFFKYNFEILITKAYVYDDKNNKTEFNTNNIQYSFLSSGGTKSTIPGDLVTFSSDYKTNILIDNEVIIASTKMIHTMNNYGSHDFLFCIDINDIDLSKYFETYLYANVLSNNALCDLQYQIENDDNGQQIYIKNNINIYKTAGEKWSPSMKNGYYYLGSQEYFHYGNSKMEIGTDDPDDFDIITGNIIVTLLLKNNENVRIIYNAIIKANAEYQECISDFKNYIITECDELGYKYTEVVKYNIKNSSNIEVKLESNILYCKSVSVETIEVGGNTFNVPDDGMVMLPFLYYPLQYCPITVIDNDTGLPMYHQDYVQFNEDVSTIEENFIYDGINKFLLRYTDINVLNISVNDVDIDLNNITITNNCIELNDLNIGDIIHIEYNINNSFTVAWDDVYNELTIYLSSKRSGSISVYFEIDNINNMLNNEYKPINDTLKHLSLNPIHNTVFNGFFYISDKIMEPKTINIHMKENYIYNIKDDYIRFYVEVLDVNGNPIQNVYVNTYCDRGDIIINEEKTDINGVIAYTYKSPGLSCIDTIRCKVNDLIVTKDINIIERSVNS